MTTLALALVLTSACAHATWNLLAKRASGGPAFVWLFEVVTLFIWATPALVQVILAQPPLGALQLGLIVGHSLLHVGYTLLLTYSYRLGDLSVVYPLARGTGPLLATLAAILFLGERPSPLALAGGSLIVVGVLALTGDPLALRRSGAGRAVVFAILTGVLIAAYTLWDKQAVGVAQIPPLFYLWGGTIGRVLLLTPVALRQRSAVVREWRVHRVEIIGVAVLSPLAYTFVLIALATSPVSYVAPAREIGILIGVVMGSQLLAEGHGRRRIAAATAMVLGVVALAFG